MLSLALLVSLSAAPLPLEQLFPKVDPAVVTVRVGTKTFNESENGAVMAISIVTGSGVPSVLASVVTAPGVDVEATRALAKRLGVPLRERPYFDPQLGEPHEPKPLPA